MLVRSAGAIGCSAVAVQTAKRKNMGLVIIVATLCLLCQLLVYLPEMPDNLDSRSFFPETVGWHYMRSFNQFFWFTWIEFRVHVTILRFFKVRTWQSLDSVLCPALMYLPLVLLNNNSSLRLAVRFVFWFNIFQPKQEGIICRFYWDIHLQTLFLHDEYIIFSFTRGPLCGFHSML